MIKTNAKYKPEVYFAKHMVNGIAQYGDDERILVTTEAIKNMCKSFKGCPVFVEHQEVDMENIQEQADGYVSKCFYNERDGWFWVEFVAVSDSAREAIKNGWSVSNAYLPTFKEISGTYLNVPYNREVVGGSFDHLAIVPNPRYEEACIMTCDDFNAYNLLKEQELEGLKNSKDEPKESKMKMFKFFKKVEVTNVDDLSEASLTLSNGQDVTIKNMIESLENATAEDEKDEKSENAVDENMKVNVGDKEMSVKELVEAYENMVTKKNADDEEKAKDEAEKEAKKNADDEAKSKEEEDKADKKNAIDGEKHLDKMKNAVENSKDKLVAFVPLSTQDKIAMGKEQY